MSSWKRMLGKFERFNYMLGEVIGVDFEIPTLQGGSYQWRIKQTQDGTKKFISARIKIYGSERGDRRFIHFDLDAARDIRDGLAQMIETLEGEPPTKSSWDYQEFSRDGLASFGAGLPHLLFAVFRRERLQWCAGGERGHYRLDYNLCRATRDRGSGSLGGNNQSDLRCLNSSGAFDLGLFGEPAAVAFWARWPRCDHHPSRTLARQTKRRCPHLKCVIADWPVQRR